MKDILLNKVMYTFDYKKQKNVIWGRILDADKDDYLIYASKNPEGYRVFKEKKSDVKKWVEERKIFSGGNKP